MFYFLLGISFILIQLLVTKQLKKRNASKFWLSSIMTLIANMSFVFAIAWTYESILETEIQASMMGLLFFGTPSLILGIITYRMTAVPTK